MMQKPDKPPAPAEQTPTTGVELAWIAVLLALCAVANSWMLGSLPDPEELAAPQAAAKPAAPVSAPARPDRGRTDRPDRQWRDPSASGLPGY